MRRKSALVIGATGIIGSYILDHLTQLDDWNALGVTRRIPKTCPEAYVSADLTDYKSLCKSIRNIGDVSHVFYAAYQDYPLFSEDLVRVNTAMLENSVKAVEATSDCLERVVLLTGCKVYGAHLGRFKTPAKESDARQMSPLFYYNQEDFVRDHQAGKSWSWTILRPDLVAGLSIGKPMNIAMAIAVYASISKELGLPLRFPGKEGAYRALVQITDASLLARACAWAADAPQAACEIFNVANGDYFRWETLWPKFAAFFEMELGPVQPIPMAEMMPHCKDIWDSMVEKYQLQPIPYERVAAWPFCDFIFGSEYDVISDTNKIKQFGFRDVLDSEAVFLDLFAKFREQRLIP